MASELLNISELVLTKPLEAFIDHTRLMFGPEESLPQHQQSIITLCQEAAHYNFKAVCVRPEFVALAKQQLKDTDVLVATVIGFPLQKQPLEQERRTPMIGAYPLEHKLKEVNQALSDGCDEFDLVMNIPVFLLDRAHGSQHTLVELRAIQRACKGKPVKVIIETDLLTPELIKQATFLCAKAKVAMVKTSTGMLDGGVGGTPEVVRLIANALIGFGQEHLETPIIGIKASGGIKTLQQVYQVIQAGADRVGTSSGVLIYDEFKNNNGLKPL